MSISANKDQATKCRADYLSAISRLREAVATITAQMTVIGTVTATGAGLLAADPDCGLSAEEVAEWQAVITQGQAALSANAGAITQIIGS